jgi:hypothetical protein
MDEQDKEQDNQAEVSGGWSASRILGILLLLTAVVVALYLVVGYLGWQSGQALRSEQEQTQKAQQLERQIGLAQEDIKNGGYDLALHRLDWVLERDPDNHEANALREQAQAAMKTALTPLSPPTVTTIPDPTAVIGEDANPEEELARLQQLFDREQWSTLLPAVQAFQREFPNFERQQSDRFLYEALLNEGLQQIQGSQIEQGILNLSQAERLGDLPQEALDYRFWANIYLEGIAYYGVNWAVSTSVFRELCLSAPFYQNACDKLFGSLVNYGNQYYFSQEYCPAIDLFREARQYGSEATLSERLTKAVEGCASATPTPVAITGTLPVTGTGSLPLPPANE